MQSRLTDTNELEINDQRDGLNGSTNTPYNLRVDESWLRRGFSRCCYLYITGQTSKVLSIRVVKTLYGILLASSIIIHGLGNHNISSPFKPF